ncbi:MAG: hypothetical protein ACI4RD_03930 [Kiritimatiellia bacterium]
MKSLTPSAVESAHAYTRSKVPWIITVSETAYGKMINYLSGGGMRTFGRTVRQEEIRRRQLRFLLVSAGFVVLWLVFLYV